MILIVPHYIADVVETLKTKHKNYTIASVKKVKKIKLLLSV